MEAEKQQEKQEKQEKQEVKLVDVHIKDENIALNVMVNFLTMSLATRSTVASANACLTVSRENCLKTNSPISAPTPSTIISNTFIEIFPL